MHLWSPISHHSTFRLWVAFTGCSRKKMCNMQKVSQQLSWKQTEINSKSNRGAECHMSCAADGHVNYRYLDTPERFARMKNLHSAVRKQNAQIKYWSKSWSTALVIEVLWLTIKLVRAWSVSITVHPAGFEGQRWRVTSLYLLEAATSHIDCEEQEANTLWSINY